MWWLQLTSQWSSIYTISRPATVTFLLYQFCLFAVCFFSVPNLSVCKRVAMYLRHFCSLVVVVGGGSRPLNNRTSFFGTCFFLNNSFEDFRGLNRIKRYFLFLITFHTLQKNFNLHLRSKVLGFFCFALSVDRQIWTELMSSICRCPAV